MDRKIKEMIAALKPLKVARDDFFLQCVQLRLSQSLDSYISDLDRSMEYLSNHISHRNIRRMTK